jgi:protein involved in polysaccharide export with SLBB domain
MDRVARRGRWIGLVLAVGVLATGTGCGVTYGTRASHTPPQTIPDMDVPKELSMTTHPPITVAPPDILRIDASRLVPLPPYKIEPLDALYLFAEGAPEAEPVNGIYPVDPDGTINLGPRYYGQVQVAGLTPQEAEKVIAKQLARRLQNPAVAVSVAQSKGVQQIRGEHLIRPDGTVGLGTYGSVYVAGMTLPQVKACVEQHLSQFLLKPEVSVDVAAFNSKWYYVISDFAGSGENVVRLPATGNETILDAISQIGGLSPVSSKKMWIARPAPPGAGVDQILPVDWKGITRRGHTRTNYQILPGDRVFVMSQPMTKVDTQLARSLAPAERLFGTTLLGASTIFTIKNQGFGFGFGGQ